MHNRQSLKRVAVLSALVLTAAGCSTPPDPQHPDVLGKNAADSKANLPRDAAIRRIEREIAEGDFESAAKVVVTARALFPNDRTFKILAADIDLRKGDFAGAVTAFQQLLDGDITGEARQGLGLAKAYQGEAEEAVAYLEDAVRQNDALWRAWNSLGFLYDARGDWQAAEMAYRKSMQHSGKQAGPYNNYGMSLLKQQRYEEALAMFGTAQRLDPALKAVDTNRRMALAMSGEYNAAVAGLQENESAKILNNVGVIAMHNGDMVRARQFFELAMERSPTFYEIADRNMKQLAFLEADGGAIARAAQAHARSKPAPLQTAAPAGSMAADAPAASVTATTTTPLTLKTTRTGNNTAMTAAAAQTGAPTSLTPNALAAAPAPARNASPSAVQPARTSPPPAGAAINPASTVAARQAATATHARTAAPSATGTAQPQANLQNASTQSFYTGERLTLKLDLKHP